MDDDLRYQVHVLGRDLVGLVYRLTHQALPARFGAVVEVRAQALRVHRSLAACAGCTDGRTLRSQLLQDTLAVVNALDAKIVSLGNAHSLGALLTLRVDRLRWSITKCLLRAMRRGMATANDE